MNRFQELTKSELMRFLIIARKTEFFDPNPNVCDWRSLDELFKAYPANLWNLQVAANHTSADCCIGQVIFR